MLNLPRALFCEHSRRAFRSRSGRWEGEGEVRLLGEGQLSLSALQCANSTSRS